MISATLKIVKKDGSNLDKTNQPSLCNNILHSLFRKVSVKVNEVDLSSCELYDYRSYLTTLLSFDSDAKNSWLESQGWIEDTARQFDDAANYGYVGRNNIFRINRAEGNEYDQEGITFTGRLLSDISFLDKPLPPETSVYLTFYRNNDQFLIYKHQSDTEEYKVQLCDLRLYVSIAHLSDTCMNLLSTRFAKEPIKYNYRTYVIRQQAISKNLRYSSEVLFPNSENPVRIFFAIVENKRIEGNYSLNPFLFGRSWTYVKSENLNLNNEKSNNLPEDYNSLKEELRSMREMLSRLIPRENEVEALDKTRDTRSKTKQPPRRFSLPFGLGASHENDRDCSSIAGTTSTNDLDEVNLVQDEPKLGATANFYIKSFTLTQNGSPVDGFLSRQSRTSATNDYLRLFRTNQMADGIFSNALNYDSFLFDSHILAYDLTCSNDAGSTAFTNPNVRLGELRVGIEFSDIVPPQVDLQLLICAEFNSFLQLKKDGSVTASFSTL